MSEFTHGPGLGCASESADETVQYEIGNQPIDEPPIYTSYNYWEEQMRMCEYKCTEISNCRYFQALKGHGDEWWAECTFFSTCELEEETPEYDMDGKDVSKTFDAWVYKLPTAQDPHRPVPHDDKPDLPKYDGVYVPGPEDYPEVEMDDDYYYPQKYNEMGSSYGAFPPSGAGSFPSSWPMPYGMASAVVSMPPVEVPDHGPDDTDDYEEPTEEPDMVTEPGCPPEGCLPGCGDTPPQMGATCAECPYAYVRAGRGMDLCTACLPGEVGGARITQEKI